MTVPLEVQRAVPVQVNGYERQRQNEGVAVLHLEGRCVKGVIGFGNGPRAAWGELALRKTHAHRTLEGAVKLQSAALKGGAKDASVQLPVLQRSGAREGVGVNVILEGVHAAHAITGGVLPGSSC